MEVRDQVKDFATIMEEKLKENEHKGGWDNCDNTFLFNRLLQEVTELHESLNDLKMSVEDDSSDDTQKVIARETMRECADVADFSMMISSNLKRKYFEEKSDNV